MINPNSLERESKEFLINDFPKYIEIRDRYFIPLTGYPNDSNWRIDTHPFLERIGVTNYAVLKSIVFIRHRKGHVSISDKEQSFKNIYFHFGLIFDCVETLSRYIIKIENLLKIKNQSQTLKLSKSNLLKSYEEWVDNEYPRRFVSMLECGKPIFYFPQRDHTYLSLIIQNPLKRTYNKFAKEIKDYRNYFIHNPGVDIFKEISTDRLFALKKEFVEISINWANIQFHFDTEKSYFEDPEEMITNDLSSLSKILNEIWDCFIERFNTIYSHQGFHSIFKNYNRELEF